MAVTSFDGSFSFRQDSLARLGPRSQTGGMTEEQKVQFMNSPFMKGVQKTEEVAWQFTCERDKQRAATDPSFKPDDNDFTAPKAFAYEKMVDYYKVLGVDEYAKQEEVKKAYKKLSLIYHPDKAAGLDQETKDENAAIFIQLKNAYATLADNPTRRQYDRDRDRDRAAFETQGHKIRSKPAFDAAAVLEKLQKQQKPPGKDVIVDIGVKLEKLLYGGHKAIKHERQVRDHDGFTTGVRVCRVDIPPGATDPHECSFKHAGDHHKDTKPDNVHFKIRAKPHDVVKREGHDLVMKDKVHVQCEAKKEPYLTVHTESVNGRHIILWGRNPFFRAAGTDVAELHARILGEGMASDGCLSLRCRLDPSAPAVKAPPVMPKGSASDPDGKVVVSLKHMKTEALLYVRLPSKATLGDVRRKAAVLLELPKGAMMRILRRLDAGGGFTPYPDTQALGDLRELLCAGHEWKGVELSEAQAKKLLRDILEIVDGKDFRTRLASAQQAFRKSPADGWAQMTHAWELCKHIMPEYGFEASDAAMQERIAEALKLVAKTKDGADFRQRIAVVSTPEVGDYAMATNGGIRSSTNGHTASSSASSRKLRSLRRFLERHALAPPGGFEGPGSESEDNEERKGRDSQVEGSSIAGLRHGEGGSCEAAAIKRRQGRLAGREFVCEVELAPVGAPLTLFTTPGCSISFYSNARQVLPPSRPSHLRPRPMFAVSISSPSCAKRKARSEWEQLKRGLLPILERTAFSLLMRDSRTILPRPLADFAASVGRPRAESSDGEESPDEVGDLLNFDPPQRPSLRVERRATRRRLARLERRLAGSKDLTLPWKRLGDEAFGRGDYFSALRAYSRRLDEALAQGEDGSQDAAIVLSNSSACFAKLGCHEEALADARRALELRPDWGRAWSRAGYAASMLGADRMQEAMDCYLKAVEFDPTGANVDALHAVARKVRQPSGDDAHKEKELGNEAMRVRELGAAVARYTVGIALAPGGGKEDNSLEFELVRSALYANRAKAFSRIRNWTAAVADGKRAVLEKANFPKARNALGAALLGAGFTEQAYTEYGMALVMEPNNSVACKGRQACLATLPLCRSVTSRRRARERFAVDLCRPQKTTKVYAISDVFGDHHANEEWTHSIDDLKFQEDVLIVAGNVADTRGAVMRVLTTLKSKFRRVFWCPGNHELWVNPSETGRYSDSIAKLWSLFELCDQLGVDVYPAAVAQGVFVVPLLSWYHAAFDDHDPFPDAKSDHDQMCRWPIDPDSQVWKYMLKLNEAHLRHLYHGTVITFSHFLPRSDLPFYGSMKTIGCQAIDEQVRQVGSKLHFYGHAKQKHYSKEEDVVYANHYHGLENERPKDAKILLVYDQALRNKHVPIDKPGYS